VAEVAGFVKAGGGFNFTPQKAAAAKTYKSFTKRFEVFCTF